MRIALTRATFSRRSSPAVDEKGCSVGVGVATVVLSMSIVVMRSVAFMELLGSVWTFEFVALTGNARKRKGHNQQGEQFHRRAS